MLEFKMDLFEKMRSEVKENVCPHCGHEHVSPSLKVKVIKHDIISRLYKPTYQVDIYTCEECCKTWKSEPYLTKQSMEKFKTIDGRCYDRIL